MTEKNDGPENTILAEMSEEALAFAKEHPMFDSKKAWEILESRPKGSSIVEALVAMLNQAYAVGYISAKREKTKVVIFPGYGSKN